MKIVWSFLTPILLILVLSGISIEARAQTNLGRIDFPTTGSEAARAHFLRGVAALHSFWYEEALEAFRESTRVDPNFLMGYWGEAMTHNHPLWDQQDTAAARNAIEKIKDAGKLTSREQAYINAVRVLYGEGSKDARDQAYASAMERIYLDYPDDLEAASFYSLSLLGVVRPGEKGFSRQMKAAAIAMDVFSKNPNHPGAAHYIIHSLDDPEHAILALPAARRYAQIAPEAHHARHMPSHIFIQLGMWPEAASSNESSWAASDEWVKRKNLPVVNKDYHSLSWLLYIYTQQGRYSKAEELLAMIERISRESNAPRIRRTFADMVATYAVETNRFDTLGRYLKPSEQKGGPQKAEEPTGAHCAHKGGAPAATAQAKPAAQMPYAGPSDNPRPPFARGLAAALAGNEPEVERQVAALALIRKRESEKGSPYEAKQVEIMELGVSASNASIKGNHDQAIEMMKRAVALEEEMSPPSGPPSILKPSHELYGEVLIRAGKPKEAAEQFSVALKRQPNRARALLGFARAAAMTGDKAQAETAYANFKKMWQHADSGLPEMKEGHTGK